MLNAFLLSVFVEWWHWETSSFHLPFGEMIITLDDVSSLCHLPIGGRLFIDPVINQTTALLQVMEDLQVPEDVVLADFDANKGFHLWIYWLRERYQELVGAERYEVVARAYTPHLMVCTLFVNNSGVYIDV